MRRKITASNAPKERKERTMLRARLVTACLAALFAGLWVPAKAQIPQTDPLARIRAAAEANPHACSATGESLCEEIAPKLIANALGDSPLEKNVRSLVRAIRGRPAGASGVSRAVAWGVSAFREAGVKVHTETYKVPAVRSEGASLRNDLANRGPGPAGRENIVAEFRGREEPNEWVLLGAPLDSCGFSAGTRDSGCDAALVVEAARDIARTGVRPRRSIRFVLFTGEKQGLQGSWAYAREHRAELDRARAVIIFGGGSGPVTGYSLAGRHDIAAGVREVLKPIASRGITHLSFSATAATDNLDFLLQGIPTLVAMQTALERPGKVTGEHAASGTFDNADLRQLKWNTAVAAVTAFGIAERAAPLGPRLTRGQIETLLQATRLSRQMKLAGIWGQWESAARGRSP
jgi:Zn-dependent M28 family amino/carboxypeptidase